MAPRPYWKGNLKLSLVACSVLLYPASSTTEKIHFHQINRQTKHRLRQQMVDEETGAVVTGEQRGRGYELSKGRIVEIEEDELEALQIEATHTIDIDSFVPKHDIDERYRNKAYYIAPDGKAGEDAFAVIRDAMKGKERVALARIVLAGREHIIAIEPFDKGMLGTTLHYPYEIRDADKYFADIGKPRVTRDMVEIAEHILEMKEGKFDPSHFKDEYETALQALVKRKAAGKPIEPAEPARRESNVIDLMEALKQSLASGHGDHKARAGSRRGEKPRTTTPRRRTPSSSSKARRRRAA